MTKLELLELLKDIPDDTIVLFYSGDEELALATTVRLHVAGEPNYYLPDCLVRGHKHPTWLELSNC